MKEIYLIIKDLLQGLNRFKYIDLDFGQLDADVPAVQYPAALINIVMPKCDDLTGQDQQVRAIINIRMAWNISGESSSLFPDERILQTLSYFEHLEAVHALLQSYTDGQIGRLSRQNLMTERRADKLKVVNMPYETYFDDVVV